MNVIATMLFIFLTMIFSSLSALADDKMTLNPSHFVALPLKTEAETSRQKSDRATKLAAWVEKTLAAEQVKVAVITREGSPWVMLFDKTGMTHSGFVFRHPETGEWMTYSLYSDPATNHKSSRLWRQTVKGFYYGQSGDKTDTFMLIPSNELQEKLWVRLTAQPFKTLLPSEGHYNLVAPVGNPLSFNCTKWVLLQLYAAKMSSDDRENLIREMAAEYPEPAIKPFFLVRHALKQKPDVNWEELSPPDHIRTVTVDVLMKSPLFAKILRYRPE